jgi:hypothetical protein
MHFRGG